MAVSTVHLRRLGTAPVTVAVGIVLTPTPLPAESLWERAATNVEPSFTGPLARSLPLVAMVLGGVMFGEQGAKRQLSGIVFGGGNALFAGQFLHWLFRRHAMACPLVTRRVYQRSIVRSPWAGSNGGRSSRRWSWVPPCSPCSLPSPQASS